MPIHDANDESICGYLKVGELYRDYQTRGFFRIGLLPAVRAEGVEFVVTEPRRFREVLAEVRPLFLARGSRQSFEMVRVTVRIEGEPSPRLIAPRIRVTESGDWDLVDGCRVRQDDGIRELPRSRLQVSGSDAGTLQTVLEGGVRSFDLFKVKEKEKGKPE